MFRGGLHSQSLDWYQQSKQQRKIVGLHTQTKYNWKQKTKQQNKTTLVQLLLRHSAKRRYGPILQSPPVRQVYTSSTWWDNGVINQYRGSYWTNGSTNGITETGYRHQHYTRLNKSFKRHYIHLSQPNQTTLLLHDVIWQTLTTHVIFLTL